LDLGIVHWTNTSAYRIIRRFVKKELDKQKKEMVEELFKFINKLSIDDDIDNESSEAIIEFLSKLK